MRVYLVGCSKSKLPDKALASEIYTSQLFRLARDYVRSAMVEGDHWYILSAMFGALFPGREIFPYDLKLPGRLDQREKWASRAAWQLDITFKGQGDVTFVILAGKNYAHPLAEKLRDMGYGVELPLEGMGVGKRMSWLKDNAI
jgi:hypothetical protein